MQTKSIVILFVIFIAVFTSGCKISAQKEISKFSNPILNEGPDPYVYQHTDGFYYCMVTRGDRLTLWKTKDFTQLQKAESNDIWFPAEKGPNTCCIWAPELHFIDGVWYIYYSATNIEDARDETRGVFVIRNQSSDPMNTQWEDMGQINTPYPGIDGNVFSYNNEMYFMYSPYVEHQSGLMIARMKNPLEIENPATLLGLPLYDWEKTDEREIMEGPQFLEGPKGKIFIVYSAGACWDDNYGLGILNADKDSDLLDPRSWTRKSTQVFNYSAENGVFGPGHNCFTKSPNGEEDWIVYHGKSVSSNECSNRSTRAHKFTWNEQGEPDFGKPFSVKQKLAIPQ